MEKFTSLPTSGSLLSLSSTSSSDASNLVSQTFKTADQIRCRLFDHRQFTSGEINYVLREYEEKREPLNPDDLNSLIVKIDSSTSKMHELVDALDSRIRETESMLSSLDPLVETVNDQILKGYESKEQQLSREQRDLERIASLTEKFNDDLVRGKMQIDERFKQIKDSLVRKYQG